MKKATLVITVIAAAASVAYLISTDSSPIKQNKVATNTIHHNEIAIEKLKATTSVIKNETLTSVATKTGNTQIKAPSQQDTEIDQASLRDTFDYFLSGFDESETNIEQLKASVKQFIANHPERYSSKDYDLFKRFLLYKQSLLSIDVNQTPSINGLERFDSELRDKQLALFSKEEQTLLFNNENLHRQVTIKKMYLKDIAVSQADYNYLLKEELSKMPDDISRVYQDDLITTELNQVANYADAQQRYIAYEAIIGSDAAIRMTELEQREEALDGKITAYLSQRREILNDNSNSNKETDIDVLRDSLFSITEQKRIRSLENIDDL